MNAFVVKFLFVQHTNNCRSGEQHQFPGLLKTSDALIHIESRFNVFLSPLFSSQGHCGSCWAFGAAEAFSDRFCVKFNEVKHVNRPLSISSTTAVCLGVKRYLRLFFMHNRVSILCSPLISRQMTCWLAVAPSVVTAVREVGHTVPGNSLCEKDLSQRR